MINYIKVYFFVLLFLLLVLAGIILANWNAYSNWNNTFEDIVTIYAKFVMLPSIFITWFVLNLFKGNEK
ncbi:MAG TPA: hypothetical protein VK177_17010 [Flavobacteriales bacterium]|nr:hypothetical protein [Flavobacteriales bacterium]